MAPDACTDDLCVSEAGCRVKWCPSMMDLRRFESMARRATAAERNCRPDRILKAGRTARLHSSVAECSGECSSEFTYTKDLQIADPLDSECASADRLHSTRT